MNPLFLVLLAVAPVQDDSARDLVERLGSDRIDVRDTSSRRLAELGLAAVPELEKAAQANDLELASRARAILEEVLARQSLLRVEDTLKSAKSLHLRFRYESSSSDSEEIHQGHGVLKLKDGNRVRMSFSPERSKSEGFTIVSDGVRLAYENSDALFRKPPPSLKEDVSTIFVRRGYLETLKMLFSYSLSESDAAVFMTPVRLTSLKRGPDDGEAKSLSYEVVGAGTQETRVKLWYHPKSYLMLKRITQNTFPIGRTSSLVEYYENLVLEPDIPEDKAAFSRR